MKIQKTTIEIIKQLQVLDVAFRLGIKVRGTKAMCFSGHDSKTPSLSFSKGKNLWKCFGCAKGGDNINLVMEALNCDFKTAIEWLSIEFFPQNASTNKIQNIKSPLKKAIPTKLPTDKCLIDTEIYKNMYDKCGEVKSVICKDYLLKHGISESITIEYGLREISNPNKIVAELVSLYGKKRLLNCGIIWNNDKTTRLIWPENTILIPFFDNDSIIYLQGRQFNSKQKYLNLQGVPNTLYNKNCIKNAKRGSILHLCEGIPDVLALASKGIAAIGILGASSFKKEWVDLFIPFRVVLLPDGDSGGEAFRKKIEHCFNERGKNVTIVPLPAGKDVSDVIAEMDI